MAVTVKGFQGTISDADMATQFGGHHAPTVRTAADLLVSAVANARQVSVAPGVSDHAFVKYASDAAQTLTLAPPSSGGAWYLVAINRQWSPTNTAVLEAVSTGATNDGTIPTAIPDSVYSAINSVLRKNPGTAGSTVAFGAHAQLAAVHVRAADTTLTVFDLRSIATGAGEISVPNFHALKFLAILGFVQEGGIVSVRQHQEAGMNGGKHIRSAWQRMSGQVFNPVGTILVDESGVAADTNDKLQIAKGAHQWLLNLATAGTGLGLARNESFATDLASGVVWRFQFNSGVAKWSVWDAPDNLHGSMVQMQGDVNIDTGGASFSVRSGIAYWEWSYYSGTSRGNNGVFAQLFPGVRPADLAPLFAVGPAYDGGDFLSNQTINSDGYLRATLPRTNGGSGWNAIRGHASWRVS